MTYIFDLNELQDIVGHVLGKPPGDIFTALTEELVNHYGGQVERECEWFLSSAAGFTQVVSPIHISMNEYLVYTGSAVPTGGGGVYENDIHDFVLAGEISVVKPGRFTPSVQRAGDRVFTPAHVPMTAAITDHVWMLEYSRGFTPGMMLVPLAATIFSTLEYRNLFRMSTYSMGIAWKQWRDRRSGRQRVAGA